VSAELHVVIVVQGNNDVYEFLSGVPVTPMTSFVDVSRDDVMREYRTVVHYMRYALAAYGWPMYMMMHTGTGLCRILPRLRSVCLCMILSVNEQQRSVRSHCRPDQFDRPDRPNSPTKLDQARPLLGQACTRLVPDRVCWCMVE